MKLYAGERSADFTSMGPTRFELVTSSLSGTRSNQLSYEPADCKGIGHFRGAGAAVNGGVFIGGVSEPIYGSSAMATGAHKPRRLMCGR